MSDEIIGTSLEDDGPAELPDATPPEAPAEPEAPAPEETPAEVEAVEVAGKKYVPLGGIIAERKQRQAAEKAASETADRLRQLEQEVSGLRPYAEILRNNPGLLSPKSPEPVSVEPSVDPDLVELAQTLDLYDPATGQPDVKKAAKVRALSTREAERVAQRQVEPLQQERLYQQVAQNYASAVQARTPDGEPVNKAVLDDLWRQAAAEPGGLKTLSDPRSVMALVLMASGASQWTKGPKVPLPPPALETEASGGNPRTRPSLSALEERIASEKGVAPSKWAERVKTYQKGVSNALED